MRMMLQAGKMAEIADELWIDQVEEDLTLCGP
jgi:hypothetical protein